MRKASVLLVVLLAAAACGPSSAPPAAKGPRAADAAVPPAGAPAAPPPIAKVAPPRAPGWPVDHGRRVTAAIATSDGGAVLRLAADFGDAPAPGRLVGLDAQGLERWSTITAEQDFGGELWAGPGGTVRFVRADGEAIVVLDGRTGAVQPPILLPTNHAIEGLVESGGQSFALLFSEPGLVALSIAADGTTSKVTRWPDLSATTGEVSIVARGGIAVWWGAEESAAGRIVRFVGGGKPSRILFADEPAVGVRALDGGRFEVVYDEHVVTVTPSACPERSRIVLTGRLDAADWADLCEGCANAPKACAKARVDRRGVVAWPGTDRLAVRFGGEAGPDMIVEAATGAVLATRPDGLESRPVCVGARLIGVVLRHDDATEQDVHGLCVLGPEEPVTCVALPVGGEGQYEPRDTQVIVVGDRALVRLGGQLAWSALP